MSNAAPSSRMFLMAGIVVLAVGLAVWMFLRGNADTVDASAKVPRGPEASDTLDPQVQKAKELLHGNKGATAPH